jgi:hypothetical protein
MQNFGFDPSTFARGGTVHHALRLAHRYARGGYADGGDPPPDDNVQTDDNVQPGDSLLMRERQTITPSSLAKSFTPPEDTIEQNLGPQQQNIMQNYPQMLSDKMVGAGQAVANMPGKMLDLAKYPGAVNSGEQTFDPHSDADIQKALDLAGMTMLGGAGGAPEGAVLGSGPIRKAMELTNPQRITNDIGLYSHGAETAAGLQQAKGTPQQFKSMLEKGGVKPAEMEGFDEAFASRPSVTRDEIAQHFNDKMPQVEETVLGAKANKYPYRDADEWQAAINRAERRRDFDEAGRLTMAWEESEGIGAQGAPKFQKYTLPGGENYREIALTLPGEEIYRVPSAHSMGDEADINRLAHLRMADRTGPNGEKILHVEEIQSDWGQKGKKEGFQPANVEKLEARRQEIEGYGRDATPEQKQEWANIMNQLRPNTRDVEGVGAYKGVPTAPYVTNTQAWTDLALKRALKEAAEGGYDKMVWTPGAEQAKRYSLSHHIDEVQYSPGRNGTFSVEAYKGNNNVFNKPNATAQEISDTFGQDIADKIASGHGEVNRNTGYNVLSGLDLETGGSGMKGYYDKIVPNQLSKLVKKLDPEAKIGRETLETRAMTPEQLMNERTIPDQNQVDFHSITITPKMRESILKGQTAFKRGGTIPFGPEAAQRAVRIAKQQAGRR